MNTALLLAEDRQEQIELVKQAVRLSLPNVFLYVATDGIKLLEMMPTLDPPPNLLLLDIQMPNLDGFGVLKYMRSKPCYDWLPIIVFSSDDSEATKVKCIGLGANHCIAKPPFAKLATTLAELINDWAVSNPQSLPKITMPSLSGETRANIVSTIDDLINNIDW